METQVAKFYVGQSFKTIPQFMKNLIFKQRARTPYLKIPKALKAGTMLLPGAQPPETDYAHPPETDYN